MRGLTFEKYNGTASCTFCGSGNTRTAMKFASSKVGKSTIYPVCMKCLRDINDHAYERAAERVIEYAEELETKSEKKIAADIAKMLQPEDD